jgi:hypothetical protein
MKMKLTKVLLLSIIVLSTSTASWSYCVGDECKTLLVAAIKKMKASKGGGYRMEYELSTKYKGEEAIEDFTTKAKIVVRGPKSLFLSDDVHIYKDAINSVTIKKEEKAIYVTNAVSSDWNNIRVEAFSILHDTLLTKFEVVACETSCPVDKKESYVDKITVRLPAQYKSVVGFDLMTYWVDRNRKEVVRCLVEYDNHVYGIKSVDFKIIDFNSDYVGEVYEGEALSKVFRNDKSVLPIYNQYSIKDLR